MDPTQPARPLRRASGRASATRTPPISGGEDSGIWRSHRRRRHLDRAHAQPRACRRASSARSASPPRPRSRAASGRWSRPRTARCSARTTAARPGSDSCDDADLRRRPWYYMHIFADPQDAEHRLGAEPQLLAVDRRRQDLRRDPDAARRQPRPVDRPAQLAAHDRGQRRRRVRHLQRRPTRGPPSQPADRAVLPRHHRRPGALPRLRLAAGQLGDAPAEHRASRARSRGRTTSSRAAARAATSPSARQPPHLSSAAASAPGLATAD